MNQLQPLQLKRFEALEQVCVNGRAVFYMVGMALNEIKQEKFYESKGFATFPDYCESIGYTRRYCDDLIISAKVIEKLPDNLRNLITNERSARALANIPASLRCQVVIKAALGKNPISSNQLKKLIPPRPLVKSLSHRGPPPRENNAFKGKSAKVEPLVPTSGRDKTGLPIPKEVAKTWERREEVATLLTDLSKVRTALRKAKESGDNLYAEVDFTDDEAKLSMVYEDLQTAMPHAVCPECNGTTKVADCGVCSGRGFVSEFYWKVKVPNDIKEITGRK
jgi:hypothetical protein